MPPTIVVVVARDAFDEVLAEPPTGEPVPYVADRLGADLVANDEHPFHGTLRGDRQ